MIYARIVELLVIPSIIIIMIFIGQVYIINGMSISLKKYRTLKDLPMKIFTHEEYEPSPRTLNFIREFARTCRVMEISGKNTVYCLN